MTELDIAMKSHMDNIVNKEKRHFSYLDFREFAVDGKHYSVSRGTFRNKMCYLFKEDVQIVCYSPSAFYTLKKNTIENDHTVVRADKITRDDIVTKSKTGTDVCDNNIMSFFMDSKDYTYILNLPIARYIKNIPFGKRSIHDIRFKFTLNGLWKLLFDSSRFKIYKQKDILIFKFNKDNMIVRVKVHRTDTVSVIVGCSNDPVELNTNGLSRLNELLILVEKRIHKIINEIARLTEVNPIHLPHYDSWVIIMWHFGIDACITYEKKSVLHRI